MLMGKLIVGMAEASVRVLPNRRDRGHSEVAPDADSEGERTLKHFRGPCRKEGIPHPNISLDVGERGTTP